MKRLFLLMVMIMLSGYIFAQDISFLHSTDGKKWKRNVNPDGAYVNPLIADDILIFYTDGKFSYDQGTTTVPEMNGITPKSWSYTTNEDGENITIVWEVLFPNGVIKKYKAEVVVLSATKLVVNLSVGGKNEMHTYEAL